MYIYIYVYISLYSYGQYFSRCSKGFCSIESKPKLYFFIKIILCPFTHMKLLKLFTSDHINLDWENFV